MRFTIITAITIMLLFGYLAPKGDAIEQQDCAAIAVECTTLESRFPAPNGYSRNTVGKFSYTNYLRQLPLKEYGALVKYFDGSTKNKGGVYCSVIDMDIDPVDLQQCADAVMRLRGEYLYSQKQYNSISFEYLSDGKPHYFSEYANGDYSYPRFRKYMKQVFNRANTRSLKNELEKVTDKNDINAGDVFIVSGNPYGHAIIVLDVVANSDGKKQIIVGQSYMPAQETQVLINPSCSNGSPWYNLDTEKLTTPEWTFDWSDLHRFPILRS